MTAPADVSGFWRMQITGSFANANGRWIACDARDIRKIDRRWKRHDLAIARAQRIRARRAVRRAVR